MTEKRFTIYGKEIIQGDECWAVAYSEYNADVIATALNELNDENQALQRHIKRNTFNKIRVEDVFNDAKYDKFYDNEEAIKSIDWIAKELGVDFE